MKKAFWKNWPYLVGGLLSALAFLSVDAMVSISIMDSVDAAIESNRTLFIAHAKTLVFWVVLLLPLQLILSFAKGLYKKNAVKRLKDHYLRGVFNQDIHTFHGENSAHYVSALTNDINTLETSFIDGVFEVGNGAMSFIVGVAVIAYINPWILVAGVVLGALSVLISSKMSKPVQRQHQQRSELFSDYTASIKEFLSAFHIIKVNNLKGRAQEAFYKRSKSIQDKGYIIDKIYTYITTLQNVLMSTVMIGLVGFSVYLAIRGEMTLGGVILVITNMEKIMRPLMELGEWIPKISSSKVLFSKLDEKLISENHMDETIDLNDFESHILLKDVSFSYEDKPVLNRVTYKFNKGGKYLITGPSGGGKTTLIRLLRKYLGNQSGSILMDNSPLEKITKESYFKMIANIEQHVFLFEDTLRHNLNLYKTIEDSKLLEALKRAGLQPFLDKNPEGLDYMIYDNGKNLSGGERSRIAIARGLLQDAKIIYLDEAFSSLDEAVAKEIEKTLIDLEDITVINVSHVIFNDTKPFYDAVLRVDGGIEALI